MIIEKIKSLWSVPVYISGAVPGSLIFLQNSDTKAELLTGYADDNWEFRGMVPRSEIGRLVFAPIRETGYEYDQEFRLYVQPWGIFRAVRQKVDRNFNGGEEAQYSQLELTKKFIEAEAKTQFAVRQVINRTVWFWALLAITFLSSLIASGLSPFWAYVVTGVAISVKAVSAKIALGLSRKPIVDGDQ